MADRFIGNIIKYFVSRCSVKYDYDKNEWNVIYHIHYDDGDIVHSMSESIIMKLSRLSLLKIVDSISNEICKITSDIKKNIYIYGKIAEDTIHFRMALKKDYNDIINFSKYSFDSYNCDVDSLTNSDSDDLLNIIEQLKYNFELLLKVRYKIGLKINDLEKQNDECRRSLYTPADYLTIKNLLDIQKQTRAIMRLD